MGTPRHPLDHPVWFALVSRQQHLSIGAGLARRFPTEISPFAASIDETPSAVAALRDLIPEDGNICIMQRFPPKPVEGVKVTFSAAGVQMVAHDLKGGGIEDGMEELDEAAAGEMFELASLTRPGPFARQTNRMGRFIGIRKQGRLVAMAGERLQVDGHCEISAVCTHPDYRGRGFGGALLTAVGARLRSEGIVPYLHAYADNDVAIALYRKMGFERRCGVVQEFWERSGREGV